MAILFCRDHRRKSESQIVTLRPRHYRGTRRNGRRWIGGAGDMSLTRGHAPVGLPTLAGRRTRPGT